MKRCPECRRDYYDDSLLYCLDDGARLLEGPGMEGQTLILPDRSAALGSAAIFQFSLPTLSQVTFSETIEQYAAWSPGADELAFSREEAGIRSIFAKDLSSGEERRLTTGSRDDIQPAWSPDGRTILFVRSRQAKIKLEPG